MRVFYADRIRPVNAVIGGKMETTIENGGVKKLSGPICPECQSTMYKDVAVDGRGRWVWYCPECGKEIVINSSIETILLEAHFCEHGHLRRSCEVCEHSELERKYDRILSVLKDDNEAALVAAGPTVSVTLIRCQAIVDYRARVLAVDQGTI